MQYKLLATKDNVEAQLNAGISASTKTVVLKAGEGANFPKAEKGAATSAGDAETLNSTGIAALLTAAGVVAGDPIYNLTDGSSAFIDSISTNSITTTPLKGGAGNTWDNADEWVVNLFVLTFNTRDTDGSILLYEEALIVDRATDTLTVENSVGRGYNGTTAQEWDADDYVNLLVTSPVIEELKKGLSTVFKEKAEDSVVVKKDGSVAMTGNLDAGSNKVVNVATPTSANDAATKDYVDNNSGGGAAINCLEDIDQGKFVNVYHRSSQSVAVSTSFGHVGYSTGYSEKLSIALFGNGVSGNTLKANIMKNGSPTDNIVVRLETDSGGKPSGTLVDANATASIAGASISTSFTEQTFVFPSSFTIPLGTKVHAVFERSGALNTSNYFRVGVINTVNSGTMWQYKNSTWDNQYNVAPHIVCSMCEFGGMYLSQYNCDFFLGFNDSTATAGNDGQLNESGIITGLSGLEAGKGYNVNGQTLTEDSTNEPQGVALSTTTLFFNRKMSSY